LKLQKVVKRGEQIILVAATSAMEVRMNGTALEDASVGQTIKVKNSSSKRVVEGVVQAPGIVKVTM
jgi:flagella basal body P-ring formation protein FlgA